MLGRMFDNWAGVDNLSAADGSELGMGRGVRDRLEAQAPR